jgi:hypothetical protein
MRLRRRASRGRRAPSPRVVGPPTRAFYTAAGTTVPAWVVRGVTCARKSARRRRQERGFVVRTWSQVWLRPLNEADRFGGALKQHWRRILVGAFVG